MQYRTLGKTGLRVSELGFGAWGIGGYSEVRGSGYGPTDDAVSLRALARAFDLGCNFIDTADAYGVGHSEEVLGKFLAGRRGDAILATKFGHYPEKDPALKAPTEANVRRYLEASLRRLGTDYIDLYQWHECHLESARRDGLAATMERLRDEGKIRHIGICVYGPTHIRQVARGDFGSGFATIQESVNVTTLGFEEALAEAGDANLGVIAREPLGNGMLAGKRDAPGTVDADHARATRDADQARMRYEFADRLRDLLPAPGRTLAQGLIRYALQVRAVSVVIPGCKTVAQVDENLGAAASPALTDGEIAAIHAIHAELVAKYGRISPYAMAGELGLK